MKKITAAIAGLLFASAAYAACTTHTYTINGRMVTCTTCCYGNNCSTNCF
jgi:hypothetical protein